MLVIRCLDKMLDRFIESVQERFVSFLHRNSPAYNDQGLTDLLDMILDVNSHSQFPDDRFRIDKRFDSSGEKLELRFHRCVENIQHDIFLVLENRDGNVGSYYPNLFPIQVVAAIYALGILEHEDGHRKYVHG